MTQSRSENVWERHARRECGFFTAHALNRCVERWGFLPTLEEEDAIMRQARSGSCFVQRFDWRSNHIVLAVSVRGTTVRVLIDIEDETIVTVYEEGRLLSKRKRIDRY